jgi:voltage-gated potassium channel
MTKYLVFIANRLWLIISLYITSLALASLFFSLLEAKSLGDGLWLSIVTSLSIGYGDIVPSTTGGRIVCALFAHFWIFAIIPLVAANIIMRVIEDKHRFTDHEQIVLFGRMERIEKFIESLDRDQK